MPTLLSRREAVLGRHTPLFYAEPLHLVSASGVTLTDADGREYLDGYNNVPHVGHGHPAVIEAVGREMARLNIHSRYLTEPPIAYAEALLAHFPARLDTMFFTNSGSEANDLALRIAAFRTGHTGILVTDRSYHGNTQALAVLTTGLPVSVPFGSHVRTFRVPDEDWSVEEALAQLDTAIAELDAAGHGLSAALFDPIFSSEGLPELPPAYLRGLSDRVHAAGGLIVGDEVQSGFGRTADHFWGFQHAGLDPDLVTLGKPMGNGFPLGGVVLPRATTEAFTAANAYFNTFATSPAAAAAGQAVLDVMREEDLLAQARETSALLCEAMAAAIDGDPGIVGPRGAGLFVGVRFVSPETGAADATRAAAMVEAMRRHGVLIGRVGRGDEMLKIRPPLAFAPEHVAPAIEAFSRALADTRP